jgi:hypothetical protein
MIIDNKLVFCTLFEKNYHHGLSALINSLYNNDFRGAIYVGYKGILPIWAKCARENKSIDWVGATLFSPATGIDVHFLPIVTECHLTNFKPNFMLELLNGPAASANGIIYLDPDIIINTNVKYFFDWTTYGISVCEDVNSPLPLLHPRRMAWREYFFNYGINLLPREPWYANGGFVGVSRYNIDFIYKWKNIQECMALSIGGLNRSSLQGTPLQNKDAYFFSPFSKTDQDALNCTIEATQLNVSFMGKDAMGFVPGLACLPHALGTPKPWEWPFLKMVFNGIPPTSAIKAYWDNVEGPIQSHSKYEIYIQRLNLKLASFIGRFYRNHGR